MPTRTLDQISRWSFYQILNLRFKITVEISPPPNPDCKLLKAIHISSLPYTFTYTK